MPFTNENMNERLFGTLLILSDMANHKCGELVLGEDAMRAGERGNLNSDQSRLSSAPYSLASEARDPGQPEPGCLRWLAAVPPVHILPELFYNKLGI